MIKKYIVKDDNKQKSMNVAFPLDWKFWKNQISEV